MPLNLNIRQRLLGLSLAGLCFVLLVGAVGWMAAQKLSSDRDDITSSLGALKAQMHADMMHDALRGDVLRALLAGMQQDAAAEAEVRKDLDEHRQQFQASVAELEGSPLNAEERASVQRLRPALDAYTREAAQVLDMAWKDNAAALKMLPAFQAAFTALETEMGRLDDQLQATAAATREASTSATTAARALIVGGTVLAAAVLMALGWFIARSVVNPLASAIRLAQAVASGDLRSDIEVRNHDEIGDLQRALREMNNHLVQLVGTVRDSSDNIATGTREIVTGNTDLCRRTEQQAASVQETASSMEQMTSTVKSSADTAQRASELAVSASRAAEQGGQVIGQIVATMDEISHSSRQIGDITSVIDGIAFQTNILALNAAVEAARAGEQGRGFAVVAGEVRALAQRAAAAAREIKTLIGASGERVAAGSRLVHGAGTVIASIVQQSQHVSTMIHEISTTTTEQSAGLAQVNQAVALIDRATQQNAAVVEQTAAAAESLQQQAQALVGAVSQFKLAST